MASPWNALLESLHSALIDELNERFPDEKPELGMPMRQAELAAPAEGIGEYALIEIELSAQKGIALIGVALLGTDSALGDALKLWQAVFKRAQPEFARRGISPRAMSISKARGCTPALPKGIVPNRVIWIPFKIDQARIYLGLGV